MEMTPRLIVEDGSERQHLKKLREFFDTTKGPVRVASAYVTDSDLLCRSKSRGVRLLISLTRIDVISGATSLDCLESLIQRGVQCRCLSGGPRLHAKVYIFGDEAAVVTSANLTRNALDSNIEVGVSVTGGAVQGLTSWFDACWKGARRLSLPMLAKWQEETKLLRREYSRLRTKANLKQPLPAEALRPGSKHAKLGGLMGTAPRFFVCNTNRRWSFSAEEQMRRSGYAAVWEDFHYPTHMQRVQPGDAILMFAKGVGIIGLGRAKAECERLEGNDPNRIRIGENDAPEWRVPVEWLAWVEHDEDACEASIPNTSFLDVGGERYAGLREAVRKWEARHCV